MVVTAGDAKIDNKKFKTVFSQKAKMVPAEDVEALTGHPVGGVCPFALKKVSRYILMRVLNVLRLYILPVVRPIRQ